MLQKLILLWFSAVKIFVGCSLVVQTSTGLIKGRLIDENSTHYYSYQGIPYAEPPVGDLRFMPPVKKEPWKDILDATHTKNVCPQAEGSYNKTEMSEDCLYLNVYVPQHKTKVLPVLVFVHGGQFKKESGYPTPIYGPRLLIQREIILVTMNFRLGALGFMSLEIEEASGNAGLKDVIMALKWIKENISNFGGNPNKITVGGNSAGSVMVQYLLLSEKSNDLFHQAIMISGSSLGYRFLALHPKENALALGKQLGLETNDTRQLLDHLKQIDPFEIVEAQDSMGVNDSRNGFRTFAPFVPSIEINYEDAMITKHPLEIIKEGIPQNVPMFIGFNTHEGLNMLPTIQENLILIEKLNKNFELCIPSNIEYPYGSPESQKVAEQIRNFYFDSYNISLSRIQPFIDLVRDTQFAYSINSFIDIHKARENSSTIYYYLFGFDDELNWSKLNYHIKYPGASHGDELGYIFETKITKPLLGNLEPHTKMLLNLIQELIVNFVCTGNPSANESLWPDYGEENIYVSIENSYTYAIRGVPYSTHMDFWNHIYDQYDNYVKNGGEVEMKIVP